jgi:uncharacterized protein YbjT (DUF2867 family)
MAKHLIIGGHGKVALRTAPLLAQEGHQVTSVIRNPDHATDIEAAGATPLMLDIETASQDELAEVFAGQDAIVWSAGAGGGNPERTYAVDRDAAIRSMDAAEQAGVKRYVMVSYMGARPEHGVPEDDSFHAYATAKADADDYLRKSGLDWTILGPGALTTEDPSGRIRLATAATAGEMRDTSRGNVAETIRVALATENSIGKQYEFVDGEQPVAAVFADA